MNEKYNSVLMRGPRIMFNYFNTMRAFVLSFNKNAISLTYKHRQLDVDGSQHWRFNRTTLFIFRMSLFQFYSTLVYDSFIIALALVRLIAQKLFF